MTVLVTGGAGFIGANLVRSLLARGHDVRVLDDLSTGRLDNLDGLSVDVVEGSITDPDAVAAAAADVSAIVHLAARGSVPRSVADPVGAHTANATGTLLVLEAARASRAHVVFSSSSSVYGVNTALPKREEMWTQPMSPYGASKLAAESYVMSYRSAYGLEAIALRFFNVYGPLQRPDHDYAAAIPRFAWRALAGEPLVVHGDGEQTRDFTHVDAVVAVTMSALERRLSWDRPVNLAFGERTRVLDVVEEIGRQLGRDLDVVHEAPRPGDVRDSQNDPTLLRELFPEVSPVPFRDGIASVLDWMRRA
ncbi:MAG: NAD-dependent epimerase/dehydratase family protein [Actinomycetota bacterium]|nr:NAD-dependent epimerase/dehydratase family protein [Actinomycetota bacterium]